MAFFKIAARVTSIELDIPISEVFDDACIYLTKLPKVIGVYKEFGTYIPDAENEGYLVLIVQTEDGVLDTETDQMFRDAIETAGIYSYSVNSYRIICA